MNIRIRLTTAAGITVLESAIFIVLFGIIAMGSLEYYRSTMRLKESRETLAQSRGGLGVVTDELQRQIRSAAHRTGGGPSIRVASTRDTLEVYTIGTDPGTVDTLRYFVNMFDHPPSLIKQTNSATPVIFARGVDSVLFVAGAGQAPRTLAVVVVSSPSGDGDPKPRSRLGVTIPLGDS